MTAWTDRTRWIGVFAGFMALVAALPARAEVAEAPAPATEAGLSLVFEQSFAKPIRLGEYGQPSGALWYRLPGLDGVLPLEAIQQKDGFIRFTAPAGDRRGLSSRIATTSGVKNDASGYLFRYGYIEARMRFKGSRDNWAAFWLLGQSRHVVPMKNIKGQWCEIDIAESLDDHRYMGTIHEWREGKSRSNRDHVIDVKQGFEDWNTFGMLWTPEAVVWYFNGKPVRSAPVPPVCQTEKVGIIIGSQKYGGKAPQQLDVEYIRVYQ